MGTRTQRIVSAAAATAVVIAISVVLGGLTSPAQQYLPDELRSFANSAGGWSMFAFVAVWLARARPVLGAVLGALSFVAMVEAYGAVSAWRGYFFAAPFSSIWIPIGLVAGPIIGGAAALVRYGRNRAWRLAGVGVLSAVLLAESLYGLTVVRATTSPVYWALEGVAGAGFLIAAVVAGRRESSSLRRMAYPASGTTTGSPGSGSQHPASVSRLGHRQAEPQRGARR